MAEIADKSFCVCFRGVRGSYPVPDRRFLAFGGSTTCHEVRVGGHLIILDAGSGIINLGYELVRQYSRDKVPIRATMLFTHVHHDHTAGFLFFKPVYFQSTRLAILGHKTFACSVRQALHDITVSPYHPVGLDEMGFQGTFQDLLGGEVLRLRPGSAVPEVIAESGKAAADDVIIRVVANPNHTKLGVLHYRIEYGGRSYVFATDVEGTEDGEDTLSEFAAGADLLAHDAQYTDDEYYTGPPPHKGWGHSTWRMACATARRAKVKRLAIIHHDPEHDDKALRAIAREAKKCFRRSFVARENQVVEI